MIEPKQLEIIITEKRNHLRTDRLDMSFGELINLYEEGTLFINPEYQRSFRGDKVRQTKFIESILLGIPVPPIFIAEDKNAKWELVDGLQRISTILAFFGILKNVPETKNNLYQDFRSCRQKSLNSRGSQFSTPVIAEQIVFGLVKRYSKRKSCNYWKKPLKF